MGNAVAAGTGPALDIAAVVRHELPQLGEGPLRTLSSSKFLKSVHCETGDGAAALVKVYALPPDAGSNATAFRTIARRLLALRRRVGIAHTPHAVPYSLVCLGSRHATGLLVRQYFATTLASRLHQRPFLTHMDRLWITFQLLEALRQCHEAGLRHGDLTPDNIAMTSWDWPVLVDWAPHKPTFLPVADPTNYLYFFSAAADRRRCCVAPERFTDDPSLLTGAGGSSSGAYAGHAAGSLPSTAASSRAAASQAVEMGQASRQERVSAAGSAPGHRATITNTTSETADEVLLPSMDVYSLGCVLGEMWCGGRPLLDLPAALQYHKGCMGGQGSTPPAQPSSHPSSPLPALRDPVHAVAAKVGVISALEDHVVEPGGPDGPMARLIAHMVQGQPHRRWTAAEYLSLLKGTLFPRAFHQALHPLCHAFLAPDMSSADARMALLLRMYPHLLATVLGCVDPHGQYVLHCMASAVDSAAGAEQGMDPASLPHHARVEVGVGQDGGPPAPTAVHMPTAGASATLDTLAAAQWEWCMHDAPQPPVALDVSAFYAPWVPGAATSEEVQASLAEWQELATLHWGEAGPTEHPLVDRQASDTSTGSDWEMVKTYPDILQEQQSASQEHPAQEGATPAPPTTPGSAKEASTLDTSPIPAQHASAIRLCLRLITSCLRSVSSPALRVAGIALLGRLALLPAPAIADSDRLQRVIPYLVPCLRDTSALVRAHALSAITGILEEVVEFPATESQIMPMYIKPAVEHLEGDPSGVVRATLAGALPRLSAVAQRFQDVTHWRDTAPDGSSHPGLASPSPDVLSPSTSTSTLDAGGSHGATPVAGAEQGSEAGLEALAASGDTATSLLTSQVRLSLQGTIMQLAGLTSAASGVQATALQLAVQSPAIRAAGVALDHSAMVASMAQSLAGSPSSGDVFDDVGVTPALPRLVLDLADIAQRACQDLQALAGEGPAQPWQVQDALSVWRGFSSTLAASAAQGGDPSPVRQAILQQVPALCSLLGGDAAESFLLPFLTTFLNDTSDWQTHVALFQCLPGLAAHLGHGTGQDLLLPICVTALADPQPAIAHAAATALAIMVREGLLEPRDVLEALDLRDTPQFSHTQPGSPPAPGTPWASSDAARAQMEWQRLRLHGASATAPSVTALLLHPSLWLRQGMAHLLATLAVALGPATAFLSLGSALHLPLRPALDGEARFWGVFSAVCKDLQLVGVEMGDDGATTAPPALAHGEVPLQQHAQARRRGWMWQASPAQVQAGIERVAEALQAAALPPLPHGLWAQATLHLLDRQTSPPPVGTAQAPLPVPGDAAAVDVRELLQTLVSGAVTLDPCTALSLASAKLVSRHRAAAAEWWAHAPPKTSADFFSHATSPGRVFHGFTGLAPLRMFQLLLLLPFMQRCVRATLSSYHARVRLQVAASAAAHEQAAANRQLRTQLATAAQRHGEPQPSPGWTVDVPGADALPPPLQHEVFAEWCTMEGDAAGPLHTDEPPRSSAGNLDPEAALQAVHAALCGQVPAPRDDTAVPGASPPPPVPTPYSPAELASMTPHMLCVPDGRYTSIYPTVPARVVPALDSLPGVPVTMDSRACPTLFLKARPPRPAPPRVHVPLPVDMLTWAGKDSTAAAALAVVTPPSAGWTPPPGSPFGDAAGLTDTLWGFAPAGSEAPRPAFSPSGGWMEHTLDTYTASGRRARRLHLAYGLHTGGGGKVQANSGAPTARFYSAQGSSTAEDPTLLSDDEGGLSGSTQRRGRPGMEIISGPGQGAGRQRVTPASLASAFAVTARQALQHSAGSTTPAPAGVGGSGQAGGMGPAAGSGRRDSMSSAAGRMRRASVALQRPRGSGTGSSSRGALWAAEVDSTAAHALFLTPAEEALVMGLAGQVARGQPAATDGTCIVQATLRLGGEGGDAGSCIRVPLPSLRHAGGLLVQFSAETGRPAALLALPPARSGRQAAMGQDVDFMPGPSLRALVGRLRAVAPPPLPPPLAPLKLLHGAGSGAEVPSSERGFTILAHSVRSATRHRSAAAGRRDSVARWEEDEDWLAVPRAAPSNPDLTSLASHAAFARSQLLKEAAAEASHATSPADAATFEVPLATPATGSGTPYPPPTVRQGLGDGTGYEGGGQGAEALPMYGLCGSLLPTVPRAAQVGGSLLSTSDSPRLRAEVRGSRPQGLLYAGVQAHEGATSSVLVSQDHTVVATGGAADGVIRLWTTADLTKSFYSAQPKVFQATSGVTSLTQLDSSATIAAGTLDGTVYVLGMEAGGGGAARPPPPPATALAQPQLVEAGAPEPARRRSVGGRSRGHSIMAELARSASLSSDAPPALHSICTMAYPGEGGIVAIQSYTTCTGCFIVAGTMAGFVHAYDLRRRAPAWTLSLPPVLGCITCLATFAGEGHNKGFSADTCAVLAGTSKGVVVVWDVRLLRPVAAWAHPSGSPITALSPYLTRAPDATRRAAWTLAFVEACMEGDEVPAPPTALQLACIAGVQGWGAGCFNLESGRCMRQLRVVTPRGEVDPGQALSSHDLRSLPLSAFWTPMTQEQLGIPSTPLTNPALCADGSTFTSITWPLPTMETGADAAGPGRTFVLNGTRGAGGARVSLEEGSYFAGHTAFQWAAHNAAAQAALRQAATSKFLQPHEAHAQADLLWEGQDWYAMDLARMPVWVLTTGLDGVVRCWDLPRPRASHTVCGMDATSPVQETHVYDGHPSVSQQPSFTLLCRSTGGLSPPPLPCGDAPSPTSVWNSSGPLVPDPAVTETEADEVGDRLAPTHHEGAVLGLAFVDAPTRLVLTAGGDGSLRLWR